MATAFDETELLERVDQDLGFLSETVQMLESDGRVLMEEIRKAVAAGDAPALGRSAHALKGMISNFCAPTAQQSALALEKMGKAGDLSGAGPAVEDMGGRLESLIQELLQFLKARS